MDEGKTGTETTEKKPRKRKAAARWAMLEMVPATESGATMEDPLYRIVVDDCKSEKMAKSEGELAQIKGAVLLVCIHESGEAQPETKTLFNWKK